MSDGQMPEGTFNWFARWDGSARSAVGVGVSHTATPSLTAVRALAGDGTRLYIAGTFDAVGSVSASGIAAFFPATGTWPAFEEGLRFLDGVQNSAAPDPNAPFRCWETHYTSASGALWYRRSRARPMQQMQNFYDLSGRSPA